jgi:DNA-binding NtrC family response regulator
MKPRILLIDDEEGARFGFTKYLSASGYEVSEAENLARARTVFSEQQFDVVILDINLPDGSGLDFIKTIRDSSSIVSIIVITGAGDIPVAVEAMRRGADNFLTKPVDMLGLELFLKKTLELASLKKNHSLRQRMEKKDIMHFGESLAMQEVLKAARLASANGSPVLITGETGTGKGVMAKWLHRHGDRSDKPFVEVNCSTLKGDLLARELFGNVRGAYTSADRDMEGLLDAADGGTLFLDEIGEMDMGVQAQFLKVIEEKTYRRLGETKVRRSEFRIICATNKDLDAEIQDGRFRQDLYFRINLLDIHLPPLRKCVEDLPDIINHLLITGSSPAAGITEKALGLLKTYQWPGNVRELKNVLERALIFAQGAPLSPEHFSCLNLSASAESGRTGKTLDELQIAHIRSVLERRSGDVTKAAKDLGISRATLYRRLKNLP